MRFETKFGIGDEVVVIVNRQQEIRVDCGGCAGKGGINLADGERYLCPKCRGRAYTRTFGDTQWYYEARGRVGKVSTSVWVEDEELKSRISYMLDTTGSGTGTLWDEAKVWTVDTYQAECDRLNALEIVTGGEG